MLLFSQILNTSKWLTQISLITSEEENLPEKATTNTVGSS